ncbi:MAG: M36 family metallopeptidase, partial [Bacteroidota bacterium]
NALDGSQNPALLCESVVNTDEVAGKIALVNRGTCFFEEKTHNAEAAGAIAVIICNYDDNAIGMLGTAEEDPTIPAISLSSSDCARLRMALANGETVTASIGIPEDSGPLTVSSGFDNGIIAHEYGHGISNRLTGGPTADGCLFNDEQMGEGWSDLFTIMLTHRPDDSAETPRGIGTYADRQAADGRGIRRRPYTSDLDVNDHDLDDIIGTTAPHPLGEVWATAVWDLYWRMIDLYGYDPDLINGTGGNNKTIQLMMDGMKFQSCNPGFEDARDALFTADAINYDGIHECLIWEVFARRGIGYSMDQGSRFDRNDNVKAFDVLPTCLQELKIAKTASSDLVEAGATVEYTLVVTNHKEEAVTGVIVEDELPDGLSYNAGSVTGATVEDLGDRLRFDLGTLAAGDDLTITYTVTTDVNRPSVTQFFDGLENGDQNWDFEAPSGFEIWGQTTNNVFAGDRAWFVRNTGETNDQRLIMREPITVTGNNPTLRFYHDYDTQPAADGGYVQISRDGGTVWEDVPEAFIRNGYRGELLAPTLFQPGIQVFWGNSNTYVGSYIDLTAYQGETIVVRFRWASDDETPGIGWYVDNFEIMDKVAYEGEACVMSNEGDMACDRVAQGGVIIESNISVNTEEVVRDPEVLQVYPNPAGDRLNIALTSGINGQLSVELVSVNGQVVRQWTEAQLPGQLLPLDVSDVPAGFYVVKVNTERGIFSEKVTISR